MKDVNTQFVVSQSMGANITSAAIAVNQLYGYAIQAVFSGSPNGTLKLQASCDAFHANAMQPDGVTTPTNWDDIADSSYTVTTAGSFTWNINAVYYNYVRLIYTRSSGTGTLNATLNGKG